MRIVTVLHSEELRATAADAAGQLGADLVHHERSNGAPARVGRRSDVVFIEVASPEDAAIVEELKRESGAAIVAACGADLAGDERVLLYADDWVPLPARPDEVRLRLAAAHLRNTRRILPGRPIDRPSQDELLYDRFTGFPTLPLVMHRARDMLANHGEITILYINFVWYEKIEELYGWQKLDEVMQTTATALRRVYEDEQRSDHILMLAHTGDNNFVVFTRLPGPAQEAERSLTLLSRRLEGGLAREIEEAHGEDIASLCSIYVGSATVYANPKIRTERLVYRGLREAGAAARSVEERERRRKVGDLRATVSSQDIFIVYHPIVLADTREVYGYEALARGQKRELRSPEVLFDVAEEANLVWELSRVVRERAVSGILSELAEGLSLFINCDAHDFADPAFRDADPATLGIDDPTRIVLEITERTAILDYPRFRDHLAVFREKGFRVAVDDAGSGYAGLGSIANLDPDYIKLDMGLITNIDASPRKQNLVRTMVEFADSHGVLVVAEGVEREEEFESVRELGVHLVQGFLFHTPGVVTRH
ncbi:MAG TPA: EAL domain-containing protein [Longimicrobiales bacterium]|nr:EAL domain-containing protein [Longimicrobiales bacterium]